MATDMMEARTNERKLVRAFTSFSLFEIGLDSGKP